MVQPVTIGGEASDNRRPDCDSSFSGGLGECCLSLLSTLPQGEGEDVSPSAIMRGLPPGLALSDPLLARLRTARRLMPPRSPALPGTVSPACRSAAPRLSHGGDLSGPCAARSPPACRYPPHGGKQERTRGVADDLAMAKLNASMNLAKSDWSAPPDLGPMARS